LDGERSYFKQLVKGVLVLTIIAVAYVNGFDVSPVFDSVSFYLATFARGSPFFHPEVFYHLTSLTISVMTLLVAGIPAALYERARGLQQSTPVSLAIWLGATVLLTWPVISRLSASSEI
jgi:hypothetical protein